MRNLFLSFFVLILFSGTIKSQSLSGQWTGGFVSGGGLLGGETEYVLELDIHQETVEGFSYTYFHINGKRYYVICKLAGVFDEASKSISVTEVSKVKSNTPPDFRDCLQTHILTFFKQGDREILKGRWKSASETNRCGTGVTELERKALVRITPVQPPAKDTVETLVKSSPKPKADSQSATKKTTTGTTAKKTAPAAGTTAKKITPSSGSPTRKPTATKTSTTTKKPSTSKTNPVAVTRKPSTQPPAAENKSKNDSLKTVQSPSISEKQNNKEQVSVNRDKIPAMSVSKFGARNKKIISTIEVPEPEFTVNLYDNGQIDGDTVTLYFNGKVIVSKQRLSTTPISIKVKLDLGTIENDLVMIAENLGSIPPNTALMVVTVGDKRYEVNITSTEQTNGTVRFKLKE